MGYHTGTKSHRVLWVVSVKSKVVIEINGSPTIEHYRCIALEKAQCKVQSPFLKQQGSPYHRIISNERNPKFNFMRTWPWQTTAINACLTVSWLAYIGSNRSSFIMTRNCINFIETETQHSLTHSLYHLVELRVRWKTKIPTELAVTMLKVTILAWLHPSALMVKKLESYQDWTSLLRKAKTNRRRL